MTNIVPVKEDFQKTLGEFISGLHSLTGKKVSYEIGTKWARVFIGDFSERTIHSFVDFSGNIYKAASDTVPAKKIRGSIYDENYSIGTGVDEHGAKFLR
jgi:hypothetical protein